MALPLIWDMLERIHAQIELLQVGKHSQVPWQLLGEPGFEGGQEGEEKAVQDSRKWSCAFREAALAAGSIPPKRMAMRRGISGVGGHTLVSFLRRRSSIAMSASISSSWSPPGPDPAPVPILFEKSFFEELPPIVYHPSYSPSFTLVCLSDWFPLRTGDEAPRSIVG